jgi:hypothetical protein
MHVNDIERFQQSLERVATAFEEACVYFQHWTSEKHNGPVAITAENARTMVPLAGIATPPRPQIICLCGSSKFVADMAVMAWQLEKEGAITVGLHLLPPWYPGVARDHQAEAEGIKEQMDELHLRKIDLADRVFVMNVGGYIGESTTREIAYAKKLGKPVGYLEPDLPSAVLTRVAE